MGADLLAKLRDAAPEWVSSRILREPAGISRAAVSKRVRKLQDLGYRIESSPRKGYRLLGEPQGLDADDLAHRLAGVSLFHHPFVLQESTESTNDDLRVLAAGGAPEGTVVFAEAQRAGRGRRGRTWFSEPGGGLLFSVLLRPPLPPGEGTLIPLLAATAVYRGLRALGIGDVGIKWPNDVLIGGRKICGILCEMSVNMDGIEFAMLGVGLNVNTPADRFPEELRDRAGSLATATGRTWNRAEVWVAVLRELAELVEALWSGDRNAVLDGWREGAVTPGQEVEVTAGDGSVLRGRAEGVSETGALRLRLTDGEIRELHSGEVSLRQKQLHGLDEG